MSVELCAGAGRVEITPPLTIPYLGYVPRITFFQGVHDPLYARALAVEGDAGSVMVIAADAIGFSDELLGPGRSFVAEVRARVQALTGVPADHVMLAATHAHSTPETVAFRDTRAIPGVSAWHEVLMDQLASAAGQAWRARLPCTLKVGTGQVPGLARDRRAQLRTQRLSKGEPPGPDRHSTIQDTPDLRLGVLVFEGLARDWRIAVLNASCHPITVQVQPYVSADFPGAAIALVERALAGCRACLFLQGATGDLNPVGGDTRDFADVARYGLILGGAALQCLGRLLASDYPTSSPLVEAAVSVVELAAHSIPPPEHYETLMRELQHQLEHSTTAEERFRIGLEQVDAEEALIVSRKGAGALSAEVQVLRLGDAALVGLPGEPFFGLGAEIEAQAAAPYPFTVGYANGYLGYLATPEAWEEGGYEVSPGPWSRTAQGAYPQLVAGARNLIAQLWKGEAL